MSLKSALMQYKESKADKEITEKIEAMLAQQKALLNSNHTGSVTATNETTKTWNPNILTEGGVSYYKLNNKCYRVSVCNNDNDTILKFRFKDAIGRWVSVSAKSIKEAQSVVDDIFGKHKYTVSACRV